MKQILLVDDSHFFIQAMKEFLTRSGNQMLTAACGSEALKILENNSPDLILMDYYLDDISGDELCRKIKAGPDTKDVPVIMFTSSECAEDMEKCKVAGCDDHITKPVDKMLLLDKIKRYLAIPTREHKRAPICVPTIYYHNNQKYSGTIFCISEGGMFIKSDDMVESGSIIQLNFSIPEIALDIEAKVEVAWNSTERDRLPAAIGPGFGARFLCIDEKGTKAIKAYLSLGDYLK